MPRLKRDGACFVKGLNTVFYSTYTVNDEEGSIAGSPWKVPKGDRAVIWLK